MPYKIHMTDSPLTGTRSHVSGEPRYLNVADHERLEGEGVFVAVAIRRRQ